MSENAKKNVNQSKDQIFKCLFCPQPKDVQFIVTEEKRNQKMITFMRLQKFRFFFFALKMIQISSQNSLQVIEQLQCDLMYIQLAGISPVETDEIRNTSC